MRFSLISLLTLLFSLAACEAQVEKNRVNSNITDEKVGPNSGNVEEKKEEAEVDPPVEETKTDETDSIDPTDPTEQTEKTDPPTQETEVSFDPITAKVDGKDLEIIKAVYFDGKSAADFPSPGAVFFVNKGYSEPDCLYNIYPNSPLILSMFGIKKMGPENEFTQFISDIFAFEVDENDEFNSNAPSVFTKDKLVFTSENELSVDIVADEKNQIQGRLAAVKCHDADIKITTNAPPNYIGDLYTSTNFSYKQRTFMTVDADAYVNRPFEDIIVDAGVAYKIDIHLMKDLNNGDSELVETFTKEVIVGKDKVTEIMVDFEFFK